MIWYVFTDAKHCETGNVQLELWKKEKTKSMEACVEEIGTLWRRREEFCSVEEQVFFLENGNNS